jgi:transcriptional regulator with GAF, ATPase, and Fis domain
VRFENPSWRNWILLVVVLLATAAGLMVSLAPLSGERAGAAWPWRGTFAALLAAYAILILAAVFFLTIQQRRAAAVERYAREAMEERSRRGTSRLYALLSVSAVMENQNDLQGVFDCITQMSVETFGCEQASLMLLDKSEGNLEVRSAFGHAEPSQLIGRTRAIGEGVAGWVAAHRKPLLLRGQTDRNCPPDLHLACPEIAAAMVVPIIVRDELVGVISVSTRAPDVELSEEDLHALQVFALNAGTSIRHTEQVAWMREVIRARGASPARAAAG